MRKLSVRRRAATSRLWLALAVIGPGIIAANADNDASGIFGYSIAGVQYRYGMLWVLAATTIALGVAQEMCARMAAVTGKGLADMIREEYGVRITVIALTALLVANFATTVSEFAGILAALELFLGPIARWVLLPACAAGLWFVIARGNYRQVERVLLVASAIYLLYLASAFMAHPNWGSVLRSTVVPDFRSIRPVGPYVFMVVNVIGTTLTPWGQFYIQSSVRDKGIRVASYRVTRADVLFGAFFTNFIAFFIIVACGATMYGRTAGSFNDVGQLAHALLPVAGPVAAVVFAIGLFNASCFGAITVPVSSAYAVTEALGSASALSYRTREAPLFTATFTVLIALSLGIVMLFPKHLGQLMVLPNIVGAVLLPIILVLMLRLINNRRIMGTHVNGRVYNFIAWLTTVVLIGLSAVLLYTGVTGAN